MHILAKADFVYDDNIFLVGSDTVGDRYLVFTPGLEFRLAEGGAASATLTYQHRFTFYRDNNELDDNFPLLDLKARYDSGVMLATGYGSYSRVASNTIDVQQRGVLIERDISKLGGQLKYSLSTLTAVSGGVDYEEVDYQDSIYTDYESISVPVTFFYRVRPKIDLTAGARYRTVDTSSGLQPAFDYEDMYYYVGAVGEFFSPVLYADVTVGFQEREADDAGVDASSASYDISFIYTGNAKSNLYISVSRDYRTSAIGGTAYAFTSAGLGGDYQLNDFFGFNAGVVFGTSEYEQSLRAEDIFTFNLGATYQPNEYLSLIARYEHTQVDGNGQGGAPNYDSNEFRVSASLRY